MNKILNGRAVELASKLKESLETIHPHPEIRGEWIRIRRFKVERIIQACNRQLPGLESPPRDESLIDHIVSVSFAQGMLEALRLLGLADFYWKVQDEQP